MAWVVVFLISFLIANFMIPNILLASLKKRLLDVPNKRSVHTVTSSRLGGLSFFPSVIVSISATMALGGLIDMQILGNSVTVQFLITMGSCFVMYCIGIFDDVVGLRYGVKFIAQLFAALLVVASGMWVNNLHGLFGVYEVTAWVGVPLSVLLIMFIMNALNLIDGIDGLCSGLSMIALFVYGAFFIEVGEMAQSLVDFALFGCLLAFFRYNVRGFAHRTLKIFMGDTGSLVTGTILSISAIRLTQFQGEYGGETFPLLLAYSVLIVPCFDVLRVMISRKRKGNNMFMPDKTHIHHKLLSLGLSARRSLVLILLMSASFVVLNVALNMFMPEELIVLVDVAVFTLLNVYISSLIKKRA